MKNLKKSSTSSVPRQKSSLPWVLVFKILRLVKIDTLMPIKTKLYLKNPICAVLKKLDNISREKKKNLIVWSNEPGTSKHNVEVPGDY